MSQCRINKLEIQGFRAFGRNCQTLEFPSPLAAIWGPNSQGKTSLAEAVEFLLTGQIVRRELMASGQDEFADSLRNAHMPVGTEAFVQAALTGTDGLQHIVRRTLITDYGKKQDCETTLLLDGNLCAEADLLALGIVLSQPPLRAPVLAQHTLGYVFSARPQDRASYFKALLEVTDLEDFRNAAAALEKDFAPPASPLVEKLELVAALPLIGKHLKPLLAKVPTLAEMETVFSATYKIMIEENGEASPDEIGERKAKVEAILLEKRAKTFPLKDFERKALAIWSEPPEDQHEKLTAYVTERGKVDEETRRLANLFREALALPAIGGASVAIDCPLCGADDTLTRERIAYIRDRVADTEAFQLASKEAREALASMEASLGRAQTAIGESLPAYTAKTSQFRRTKAFRVERIRQLLGQDAEPDVSAWLSALRRLARRRTVAVIAIRKISGLLHGYAENIDTLAAPATVEAGFAALAAAYSEFASELAAFGPVENAVSVKLKAVVDSETETARWQDVLDLAGDQKNLRAAIIDRSARAEAAKELTAALKQIDKGNETVLEEKFSDLSDGVQKWWDLLRPDELSYFTGVKPRPGARRTIDFKAGLATSSDRSNPKLRDVVAVFSQSQLHCLGLALFLARSVKEGSGFIVLDDPIISSDEDYRAFFNAMVIEELLKLGMQVIVLTQDQRTWKDLGERYLYQNISLFQIVLQVPADGSAVANTADDLETKFIRADTLVRGGHPTLHKQAGEVIREAAERFCKEAIVKERRAKGDTAASLNDYDQRNLGQLTPLVEPLLGRDPSHPGKLRAIGGAVNPANHDDAIPAAGVLKVALGDLKFLKKTYL